MMQNKIAYIVKMYPKEVQELYRQFHINEPLTTIGLSRAIITEGRNFTNLLIQRTMQKPCSCHKTSYVGANDFDYSPTIMGVNKNYFYIGLALVVIVVGIIVFKLVKNK